jgi:NADH:ubiquinone oxidoreductase subunit C
VTVVRIGTSDRWLTASCATTPVPFVNIIDICGVDYPAREKRFDVVYHLLSADARTSASA